MKIAVLSASKLPTFLGENHPTEESLFAEDLLLIDELNQLGHVAERVAWRQKNHSWYQYDMAVIRSTWDYIDHLEQFLSTLKLIESQQVRVINPYATVAWNYDKRYLKELLDIGVAVVPSLFFDQANFDVDEIKEFLNQHKRIVIKPVVGVGGFGVEVISDSADLLQLTSLIHRHQALMAQPFLASIQSEGEWSFVFGVGDFLYATLKTPREGDYRVQVMYGAQTRPMKPTKDDLQTARGIYHSLPVAAQIARIDMVRLDDGKLALMEAELIEPQLYFHDVPDAAKLVARAILAV